MIFSRQSESRGRLKPQLLFRPFSSIVGDTDGNVVDDDALDVNRVWMQTRRANSRWTWDARNIISRQETRIYLLPLN